MARHNSTVMQMQKDFCYYQKFEKFPNDAFSFTKLNKTKFWLKSNLVFIQKFNGTKWILHFIFGGKYVKVWVLWVVAFFSTTNSFISWAFKLLHFICIFPESTLERITIFISSQLNSWRTNFQILVCFLAPL